MSLLIVDGDAACIQTAMVACGLGACLARQGWRVAPLSAPPAGPPLSERIVGASHSRLSVVLAEACGLAPEDRFVCLDGNVANALKGLRDFETVIALGLASSQGLVMTISGQASQFHVTLGEETLGVLPEIPADSLFPQEDGELAALPPQIPGRPRIGIVSLPHISNFASYSMIRGAEWIAGIMPGNFDVILLPESANPASDRQWLSEQGLREWLVMQKLSGSRLIAFSEGLAPQARVEDASAVAEYRRLSAVIGARIQAPLPSDEDFDRLAGFVARHLRIPVLEHALRHGSGLIVE